MIVTGTRFTLYGFISDAEGRAVGVANDRIKDANASHSIGQRTVRVFGPWNQWAKIAQAWSGEMNRLEGARMRTEGVAS